jgi:hypothetical protein
MSAVAHSLDINWPQKYRAWLRLHPFRLLGYGAVAAFFCFSLPNSPPSGGIVTVLFFVVFPAVVLGGPIVWLLLFGQKRGWFRWLRHVLDRNEGNRLLLYNFWAAIPFAMWWVWEYRWCYPSSYFYFPVDTYFGEKANALCSQIDALTPVLWFFSFFAASLLALNGSVPKRAIASLIFAYIFANLLPVFFHLVLAPIFDPFF